MKDKTSSSFKELDTGISEKLPPKAMSKFRYIYKISCQY